MATKLTFLHGSTPVSGAQVLVGSLVGQQLTTGIRGAVNFTLDEGWAGVVDVYAVETDGRTSMTTMTIVSEAEHTIQLGELPES